MVPLLIASIFVLKALEVGGAPEFLLVETEDEVGAVDENKTCEDNQQIVNIQKDITLQLKSIEKSLNKALVGVKLMNKSNKKTMEEVHKSEKCLEIPPVLKKSLIVLNAAVKILNDVEDVMKADNQDQDYFFDLAGLPDLLAGGGKLMGKMADGDNLSRMITIAEHHVSIAEQLLDQ